jgi:hypothetical protein
MRTLALCAAVLACAVACGSEPRKPPALGQNSLLSSVALAPSYSTPACWRYHPAQQAQTSAERRLSDGRILLAGKRGERWVLDPRAHSLSAGASLAPENLIAVLDSDQGYWFVGESGTSYEARDPLGKFLRSSAPLEPLVRVSAAGHSIIGIPADHSLSRSADGAASFAKVGPANVTFADVELANDGIGLALAIPEALWLTRDEGVTWSPLPGKTRGALALARSRSGHLRVDTVFGSYHFVDQPPRLEAGVEPEPASSVGSDRPPRGPDAAALADGRALIQGSRYLEVSAAPAHPSDYELFQGPLDGKLEPKAVPELKGCRSARLAGFENFLELACFGGVADAGSEPVSIFRSDSAGASRSRRSATRSSFISRSARAAVSWRAACAPNAAPVVALAASSCAAKRPQTSLRRKPRPRRAQSQLRAPSPSDRSSSCSPRPLHRSRKMRSRSPSRWTAARRMPSAVAPRQARSLCSSRATQARASRSAISISCAPMPTTRANIGSARNPPCTWNRSPRPKMARYLWSSPIAAGAL